MDLFKFRSKKKKLKGWTLTEILIVLAIIGILVMLVLPNQTAVIGKAKAKEAQLQLDMVYKLQLSNFYERSKYSDDLKSIGFIQEKLVSQGGQANYKIELIEASNNHFKATATSVTDFDGDGSFNVWQIDHEKNLIEVIPD
ncbi:type II secretion system protein [bacterium SCSIO 12643]|nr:type II secretion system protein [bacterium SCSIO 12643]